MLKRWPEPLENLLADAMHLHRQPVRHGGEDRTVDAHAGLFHPQQHRDQRQIDIAIHLGAPSDSTSSLSTGARRGMASADAGSSSSPGGGSARLLKRATTSAQGMRGVGWIDEIGIEHQVIDLTRQPQAMARSMRPRIRSAAFRSCSDFGVCSSASSARRASRPGRRSRRIQTKNERPARLRGDRNLQCLGSGLQAWRLRRIEQAAATWS